MSSNLSANAPDQSALITREMFQEKTTAEKGEYLQGLARGNPEIYRDFVTSIKGEMIIIQFTDQLDLSSRYSLTYELFVYFLHEGILLKILMLPGFTHVQQALDDMMGDMRFIILENIYHGLYPQIIHLLYNEKTNSSLDHLLSSSLKVRKITVKSTEGKWKRLSPTLQADELNLDESTVDQFPKNLKVLRLTKCTIFPEEVPNTVRWINIERTKLDETFLNSFRKAIDITADSRWKPTINFRDCDVGDAPSLTMGNLYSAPVVIENLQSTHLVTLKGNLTTLSARSTIPDTNNLNIQCDLRHLTIDGCLDHVQTASLPDSLSYLEIIGNGSTLGSIRNLRKLNVLSIANTEIQKLLVEAPVGTLVLHDNVALVSVDCTHTRRSITFLTEGNPMLGIKMQIGEDHRVRSNSD